MEKRKSKDVTPVAQQQAAAQHPRRPSTPIGIKRPNMIQIAPTLHELQSPATRMRRISIVHLEHLGPTPEEEDDSPGKKKKKWGPPLPWWCLIFAWVLVVLVTCICAFHIVLYTFNYGYSKSYDWVMSVFVSKVFDILLFDPMRIAFFCCVFTYFSRKYYIEELPLDNIVDNDDDAKVEHKRKNFLKKFRDQVRKRRQTHQMKMELQVLQQVEQKRRDSNRNWLHRNLMKVGWGSNKVELKSNKAEEKSAGASGGYVYHGSSGHSNVDKSSTIWETEHPADPIPGTIL